MDCYALWLENREEMPGSSGCRSSLIPKRLNYRPVLWHGVVAAFKHKISWRKLCKTILTCSPAGLPKKKEAAYWKEESKNPVGTRVISAHETQAITDIN